MKIGILGGGQLGRMLALAAYPLGMEVRCFDPSPQACAGQVSDLYVGEYTDKGSLEQFCHGIDLITYEFENIPHEAVDSLPKDLPIYPSPHALEIGQDRYKEKVFFRNLGIPIPEIKSVNSEDQYFQGIEELGYPVVVKTRRLGYDGKGQFILKNDDNARKAWNELRPMQLILEKYIAFDRELSLLGVRSITGQIVFYPLIENIHRDGILRLSQGPVEDTQLQSVAEDYAQKILHHFQYVGVLAIEFFEYEGNLLVNEMAPRVHNSGHWTIEGATTSQFENHIRAIVGYPLGIPTLHGYFAMLNIIGKVPEEKKMLSYPGLNLHLYGKTPRKNRKLGHLTLLAPEKSLLEEHIASLQNFLEEQE